MKVLETCDRTEFLAPDTSTSFIFSEMIENMKAVDVSCTSEFDSAARFQVKMTSMRHGLSVTECSEH